MKASLERIVSHYGMLGVLAVLCMYFSWATLKEQQPMGAEAARDAVKQIGDLSEIGSVLVVTKRGSAGDAFVREFTELVPAGINVAGQISGDPRSVRTQLESLPDPVDVIATTSDVASWPLIRELGTVIPPLSSARVVTPRSYTGSDFLKPSNLRNVLSQIVVIAITAVGMTLVIITAGIDLSVGSLIALSAVCTGWLIRSIGGEDASAGAMLLGSLGAIGACGLIGLFSGVMVTRFRLPPFIATLGMMQIASGLAYIIAKGQSIQIADGFDWLGTGASLLWIPNAVLLMAIVYGIGHMVMSKTVFGRHVYAVGGNPEAARLSGVPVQRVLLSVYVISGITAGIGGVVLASQLESGAPTYGLMYELYAIAAVVVGGTSLAGGEGRVMGTLIGALIIAVIQNGMNLTGVESYTQKIVLGAVILGAVLLDMLRRHGWRMVIKPNA